MKTRLFILAALLPLALAACESDVPPPQRHAEDRAASSNISVNSPEHEYLAPAPDAVPLVRVDLPNNSNEKPKVTTIVDEIHTTLTPPPPAPAATPAAPTISPPTSTVIERGSPDTSAPPPTSQP